MHILLVIPTYEPDYVYRPDLERFYTDNFDSFLKAEGDVNVQLVITDFASSKSYKSFLRNFVKDRPDCYLIDGEQEASLHVAVNIALSNFNYDYLAYAACDLRARDRDWLKILLQEFDDPKVQIVVPTVTMDGNKSCKQNQPTPIQIESRTIGRNELFNLHCAIISRRFFEHFDNRYPDVFDCNFTEGCLMYQMAALGYSARLDFRVNMVHGSQETLPFKPGTATGGWRSRNDLYEADRQRLLRRTPHLPNLIATSGGGFTRRIRIHLEALKFYRWRYFYFRLFSKQALDDFSRLDLQTKVEVMKALFYRPMSDYENYSYSIYPSVPSDDQVTDLPSTQATVSV